MLNLPKSPKIPTKQSLLVGGLIKKRAILTGLA